jgi:hypothetical protein
MAAHDKHGLRLEDVHRPEGSVVSSVRYLTTYFPMSLQNIDPTEV